MNGDDKLECLIPCKHLPTLTLATSITNKIYLLDISRGALICELENRKNFERLGFLNTCFACNNQLLFLKYVNPDTKVSKLYAHTLKLISKLENYFVQSETNTYSYNYNPNLSLNERMKSIMSQRITQQYNRKERVNSFWKNLKELNSNSSR